MESFSGVGALIHVSMMLIPVLLVSGDAAGGSLQCTRASFLDAM